MRIGYSWWGFLADEKMKNGKLISSPDGNATYSWTIIHELQKRGHEVYQMMPDRDYEYVTGTGYSAFKSFCQQDRYEAYRDLIRTNTIHMPDLDLLLHEWRMPIFGRNTPSARFRPDFQPDYDRQWELLGHYRGKCPVIGFDLDYQMTDSDEMIFDRVLDLGHKPGFNRVHTEIPFDFMHMDDFKVVSPYNRIAYIGNRYARDEAIEKYLAPISHDIGIHLYGNWLEGGRNSLEKWPAFHYYPRVTSSDFRNIYCHSSITPLLAKEEYCTYGFMTARIWECLFFGTLPVGMAEFDGIERYLPNELIVNSADELLEVAKRANTDWLWRHQMIMQLRDDLEFMDVRNLVTHLLDLA